MAKMAYVSVPKDLGTVKNKIAFNLTIRQIICFGSALVVGLSSYFVLKTWLSGDLAAFVMILLVLPFFLFALYEKNGQPLEEVVANVILLKFGLPNGRPYATNNLYKYIQNISNKRRTALENKRKAAPKSGS
jgi:hypothetical protein